MSLEQAQKRLNKKFLKRSGRSKFFSDIGFHGINTTMPPRPHANDTGRFKVVLTKRRAKSGQVTIGSW